MSSTTSSDGADYVGGVRIQTNQIHQLAERACKEHKILMVISWEFQLIQVDEIITLILLYRNGATIGSLMKIKILYLCFMISKKEILEKLNQLKPILQKEYSVNNIGLFGSFSNDSFSDKSDIDILVEFDKPIGWKFFTLEIYLENIFGRKIDLVTKNALKDHIKNNILKQVKYI